MPAIRTRAPKSNVSFEGELYGKTAADERKDAKVRHVPANPDSILVYPTGIARARFRMADGKALTGHQWKIYDALLRIPVGRVVTYGELARATDSSPRAVGGALRSNPFAPEVPCHRVIASNLFIGGFQGEWAQAGSNRGHSPKLSKKLDVLKKEEVSFDQEGKIRDPGTKLWQFP